MLATRWPSIHFYILEYVSSLWIIIILTNWFFKQIAYVNVSTITVNQIELFLYIDEMLIGIKNLHWINNLPVWP